MNRIVLVLLFFILISLGVAGFFIYKAGFFSPLSTSQPINHQLINLLDDCSYRYTETCIPQVIVGAPLQAVITQMMIEALYHPAYPRLSTYKEFYTANQLQNLLSSSTGPSVLTDREYSIPEMVGFVSNHWYINYKLLVTLLAMGGNSYWDREPENMANPFSRSEPSFLYQLDGVASDLRGVFDQNLGDTNTIVVGSTNFVLPNTLSQASKALYIYFANTSKTPEEFMQKISTTDKYGFTKTWERVTGVSAYTPGTPVPVIQTANPDAVRELLMREASQSATLK